MIIKGKEIGKGKPCVCVPVMGKTKEAIVDEVLILAKSQIDIIEWRVDAFDEYKNYNAIRDVLQSVAPYLQEKIFLYTFRMGRAINKGESCGERFTRILLPSFVFILFADIFFVIFSVFEGGMFKGWLSKK